MENYKKRAIRFLVNLSLKEQRDPRVVKYSASKTEINKNEEKYFPRNIGGPGGRYAYVLTSMLEELETEKRAALHSIMVLHGGEVIAEASANGYSTNTFHLAHSMSKTVTGIAIGLLFDENKIGLDDIALSYFPEINTSSERAKAITVSDLLTMRSGASFGEVGVVSETDWTRAFFESEIDFSPSERFKYNSMNSYILARIVTRITGKTLSEYLREKLFAPLEINNYLWELGPEGTEKGGFGLYLSAESFLKIGLMLKNEGVFGKRRILSKEFISLMLTPYSTQNETKSEYGYGLHIWVSDNGEEFLLNGMLGQNVWVSKRTGFIVSMNAGNSELFSESPALSIVRKHLLNPEDKKDSDKHRIKRLKEISESFRYARENVSPLKEKRGLSYLLGFKNSRPFDTRWDSVLGEYAPRSNNASLLPLFVRIMQNNFPGGIERISLKKRRDSLILTSTEGGKSYEISVGLYGYSNNVLDFGGEKYIIRAGGECAPDEDKKAVYKIELTFPELPNSRLIKITKSEGGIMLAMSESPDESVAKIFFDSITGEGKTAFAIGLIEKKMGQGFFKEKIEKSFNPTLDLIDTKNYGWEAIITRDNLKLAEERESSSKFISSLISKFLSDKPEDKEKNQDGILKGFFGKVLSMLFDKLKPEEESKADTIEISDDIITFLDNE